MNFGFGHKTYNVGRPFLGHHYDKLSSSVPYPREKNIFKEMITFNIILFLFYPYGDTVLMGAFVAGWDKKIYSTEHLLLNYNVSVYNRIIL